MTAVLWSCTAGQMHPLYQWRYSRNWRLRPRFLLRVVPSCFASFNGPSQRRATFMQKETGRFWTLLSNSVLTEWKRTESVGALCGVRLQHACFKVLWKKMVPACLLAFEERCSTSGPVGLLCWSIWTKHTTTCSWCHVPEIKFCWQENIRLRSVDTVTLKLSLLTCILDCLWFQLQKCNCLLLRVHALSCIFFTVQLRSSHWRWLCKWSVSQFMNISNLSTMTIYSMRGPDWKEGSIWAIIHTLSPLF